MAQMMSYDNILNTIRNWPLSKRLTLVQDILKTLAPDLKAVEPDSPRAKRNTLKEALGLLATNQPAPSDQEIQDWLNEHRLEKYG